MKTADININAMMTAMDIAYLAIKDLNEVEFTSVIATMIDQWSTDHDKGVKEACKITSNILEVQPKAWAALGPMKKTKEKEYV